MPTLRILPDDIVVDSNPGESVLEASLRAGIAHAHACGGHAHCSTCRVEVKDGIDDCAPRTIAGQIMADKLGFGRTLRLACQVIPQANLTVRRLVLDEDDVALADQRKRSAAGTSVGEERKLAILFADIRGFTAYSEPLPPYDVVHVLNRFFNTMGQPIKQFGGFIDNYMGDGLMALFGLRDEDEDSALRSVRAGLAMLVALDALKPYMETAFGHSFDIGIGIHYGEAVVGSVGAIGQERVTAIGDAVNFASRIESVNKIAGTRLLVSEAMHAEIGPRLQTARSLTTLIPGKSGEYKLYEVVGVE